MKPLKRSEVPTLPVGLCWRTVKVPKGTHGPYMVAGAGWHGIAHHTGEGGRTVPCVDELTNGELRCEACKYAKRFACYVPLFATQGGRQTRIVLQGAKRTWATWQALKFGDLCSVVKGAKERDTILFTPSKLSTPTTDLSRLRAEGPQDIDAYLLHLWQDRALCEWQECEWFPSIRTLDSDKSIWILEDGMARPLYGLAT